MKKHTFHTLKGLIACLLIAVLVMVSVLVAPNTIAKAATAPSLTKTSGNILEKGKLDLNVKNKVKGSTYSWTTSNKKIATVDKYGVVTGVKKGNVVITCTIKTAKKTHKLTSKLTVIKPATSISIRNKITALNLGQKYDVNASILPSTSNDLKLYKSSNTAIATVDKNGVITTLKAGKVTISAKTLSGKYQKMPIIVTDKVGTVTSQKELDALLGSNVKLITIKTNQSIDFTIKSGDYSKTKLVVDAPYADVHNNGTFKSIDIKQIAAKSWYENAVGNILNVLAKAGRIVVGSNAKVSININAEGAKIAIDNNGIIEEITVDNAAELTFTGDKAKSVPLVINSENVTITSSVPLNLEVNAKVKLVLLAGAEATKVVAASESVVPDVYGDVKITVQVGKGSTATTKTVEGKPIENTTGGGGFGGGGVTPSTPSIVFDTALEKIDSILLTSANGNDIEISDELLTFVKGLLSGSAAATAWRGITEEEFSVSGQTIVITGSSTSYTKSVSIEGGKFDGKTFDITVNSTGTSVTIKSATNKTVTLTKSADDKSFSITSAYLVKNSETPQTAEELINSLSTVTVGYDGKLYVIDWPELTTIQKYVDSSLPYITWMGITSTFDKVVDGQTIRIVGSGETKTVSFVDGQFAGKSYTVTMRNDASVSITNGSGVTATIARGSSAISITLNK